jgi:hypothetical protein
MTQSFEMSGTSLATDFMGSRTCNNNALFFNLTQV